MSSSLNPEVTEDLEHEDPSDSPKDTAKGKKQLAGRSPTQIALSRLRSDKVALVSSGLVLLLIVLGLAAPLICNWLNIYKDYSSPDALRAVDIINTDPNCIGLPNIGPPCYGFTSAHPLGVEPNSGYDNLALLLYGLRTSLFVATLATVFSTLVGVSLGLIAGYARGYVDSLLSFFIDFFLSFPFILGALALSPIITSHFGSSASTLQRAEFIGLISVLVLFGWMSLARLIRGQVLSLREREFVLAARVIGVPTRQILFKELLPNLVAPIVVAVSLMLPAYVTAEAGLSFLGIGLSETESLGRTINKAANYFDTYPLYLWAPVLTVMVLVIALNLVGDSIRDAFDPKTRR